MVETVCREWNVVTMDNITVIIVLTQCLGHQTQHGGNSL